MLLAWQRAAGNGKDYLRNFAMRSRFGNFGRIGFQLLRRTIRHPVPVRLATLALSKIIHHGGTEETED
jgi:hypothetical protein